MTNAIEALTAIVVDAKSPIMEVEQETLLNDWKQVIPDLPPEHERVISSFTRQIRICYVRTLLNAVEIGKYLYEAREFFTTYYSEQLWSVWIEKELTPWSNHFSIYSAINYINSYFLFQKYPTLAELKMSMRVCYLLARRNVPNQAIEEVIDQAKSTGEVSYEQATKIVQSYKKEIIREEFNLSEEIWSIAKDTKITKSKQEMRRFLTLSKENQMRVLEVVSANPQFNVREALTLLKQQEQEKQLRTTTKLPFKTITKSGKKWQLLADKAPSESFDLILCEPPMTNDWLPNYGELLKQLERMLKPSGRLLLVAGQQNAIYVGHYQQTHAPELRAGWLFFLRARAGESKRILGLNISASYIPIIFFYRPPFESLLTLVSDMLSFDPTNTVSSISNESITPVYTSSTEIVDGALVVHSESQVPKINTIEDCVHYYSQSLLQDKEEPDILYFAPETGKRLGNAFYEGLLPAAKAVRAKTLTVYLGI